MPIFPVFRLNIGKNTSESFLKKSIDRKKISSSNVVSYAKMIQKNAWASLLQFAGVTMPHLPHVGNWTDTAWTDRRDSRNSYVDFQSFEKLLLGSAIFGQKWI